MKPRGWFDRFADHIERIVAAPAFFFACVLLVLVWAPTIFLLRSVDTWQLIINTITTIVTFLLVALLTNRQRDGEKTSQEILRIVRELNDR